MKKIFASVILLNFIFINSVQATTTFVQSEDLQNTTPEAITFNNDGTRMFVIDDSRMVDTYTLTTGFNITTKSLEPFESLDITATNPSPRGIVFNNDGSEMTISNAAMDIIEIYALLNPYDPGTSIGVVGTHDTSGEER